MNSRLLRRNGTILVVMTILALLALPFWMSKILDWIYGWVQHGSGPAIFHFLAVLLFLPLLTIAIGWMGFLIAWFVARRAEPAHSPQNANRLAEMRTRLLVLAGAVALIVTTLVEPFYLDWMGGAIGSSFDQSDHALLHLYLFIEAPQLFLALLWTALLVVTWLPQPNSPASKWRLYPSISFLMLVVAALVWAGYPYWTAGIETVSVLHKQIPVAAIRTFEVLPALFVTCLWICLIWFLGSSLRARRRHALGQP
jgi:Na+-transporting methylmalonyl-CoA/oxaloacetate decarboxylase gamma subunit